MFEKFTSAFKEIMGEKHEVTDSIREALADRLSSPFYGYFLISWLIVNWDFVYTAFFVDGSLIEKKTGLLKNEFLLQKILPAHYSFPEYWWTFFILPFLVTVIVFWLMPTVTEIFYRKHLRNKIKLEEIKASETAANVRAETEILKAEVAQAKVEKEAEKVSPELLWKKEYEEFKKHVLFQKFPQIIESVYTYDGNVFQQYDERTNSWPNFRIDQQILVYCDVNGLISKISDNKIELTPKGREFVKLYSQ